MKKIVLLFLIVFLFGCSAIRFPSLPTPKKPRTVYNWHEVSSIKPRAVIVGKKVVIVEDKTMELTVGYEKIEPRMSFMQKLGSYIAGLSMLGIILLILGLFMAPGATIGFLLTRLKKWKKATRQIVSAIDESDAVKTNDALKTSLSEKQNKDTEAIVDAIKRKNKFDDNA